MQTHELNELAKTALDAAFRDGIYRPVNRF